MKGQSIIFRNIIIDESSKQTLIRIEIFIETGINSIEKLGRSLNRLWHEPWKNFETPINWLRAHQQPRNFLYNHHDLIIGIKHEICNFYVPLLSPHSVLKSWLNCPHSAHKMRLNCRSLNWIFSRSSRWVFEFDYLELVQKIEQRADVRYISILARH